MFKIALVGYTNAGKSTLMRELSGADVHAGDRLFATLDTTVRQIEVANDRKALLSIRKTFPAIRTSRCAGCGGVWK